MACNMDARFLSFRLQHEFVSNAMYSLDVYGARRIRFKLGAQTGDVVVHGSSDGIGIQSPNLIQQFVAGDNRVFAGCKESEKVKFLPCHLYRFSTAPSHVPVSYTHLTLPTSDLV